MKPSRTSWPAARRRVRGAALVEFVVIAAMVLVPMYLAVQALGKFADVRSTMLGAARYAAWERTVWSDDTSSPFATINAPNQKSTAAILNEVRVRVINGRASGTLLRYKDTDKSATTYANGVDPMWRDTVGKAFLDKPGDFTASIGHETPAKDFLGKAIGAIGAISVPHVTGSLVPPVPTDTMAVASLQMKKVAAASEVYKRLWSKKEGLPTDWDGLDFAASGAILSNTWAANGSTGTKQMVATSVPTANGLGTAVELATDAVMLAWDPLQVVPVRRLDLGRIAVDVVPPDRLR